MIPKNWIFIALNLLISITSHASFEGGVINLHVGQEMNNNGVTSAGKKLCLTCGGTIKGNGRFEAPEIEIRTKKFEFTGTISCTKKCVIIVQEPFDQAMFKRTGGGEFVIKIESVAADSKAEEPERTYTVTIDEVKFTFIGRGLDKLLDAFKAGDTTQAIALLEKADISKESLGLWMLVAGFYGHRDLVKECIRLGADVNGTEGFGPWPAHYLHLATWHNKTALVQALLDAGAKPDVTAKFERQTSLMYAAHKGLIEIARALLLAGADPYKKDTSFGKCDAFDYACDEKMIRLLRNRGIEEKPETKVEAPKVADKPIQVVDVKIKESKTVQDKNVQGADNRTQSKPDVKRNDQEVSTSDSWQEFLDSNKYLIKTLAEGAVLGVICYGVIKVFLEPDFAKRMSKSG